MLEHKWYPVAEDAQMTGLTDRTIRNYLKDGTMHGKKIGVQWRFTEDDINALFQDVDFGQKLTKAENNLLEVFLREKKEAVSECSVLDIPEVQREAWDTLLGKIEQEIRKKQDEVRFAWEYDDESGMLRVVTVGEPKIVHKMTDRIKKELKANAE